MIIKKTIMWMFVFLCLVGIVNSLGACDGTYPTNNPPELYYDFEEGDNITIIDQSGGEDNGSLSGNNNHSTNAIIGTYSMIFDDGEDDYITTPLSQIDFNEDEDWSLHLWVNTSVGGIWGYMITTYDGGFENGDIHFVQENAGNNPNFRANNGVINLLTGASMAHGQWAELVVTHNTSNNQIYIYQNGTLMVNGTDSNMGNNGGDNITIGSGVGGVGGEFDGLIDEVGIYNYTLSQSEVTDLWNGGNGIELCTPLSASINIGWINPPNTENQYNTVNLTFNFSVNWSLTNPPVNCSVLENGTINQTLFNVSNTTTNAINILYSPTLETAYSYSIFCENNQTNTTSSNRTVYIDNVFPTITDNFVNDTTYYATNLSGQFNFSDSFYLHRYNITIDSTTIVRNVTDVNSTSAQYNMSYDLSGLAAGNHTLTVLIADGHTAKSLGGNYEVSDGLFNDYLQYTFWDEGYAKIKALPSSIFDEFSTKKEGDRYSFAYEPSEIKEKYDFVITSDLPIHIVNKPNSKYKKWLIMGDHWLDFYQPNEPGQQISIKRTNDYEVIVSISGLKHPELQQYASIGDLNVVTQNYTFKTVNMSVIYSPAVNELEEQTITLIINTTAGVNSTAASLFYNGTRRNVTGVSFGGYDQYNSTFITPMVSSHTNITFYWLYNVTGNNSFESGNITLNQTVYRIGIDNCSVYTTEAFNITLRNETDDSLVTGSLAAYFEAYISSTNSYRSFNLSWSDSTNFSICIDPNNATYQVYAQLEYGAANFNTETYYFTNLTLDNITDNTTFYLTSGATLTTFTVTDENDNAVEDLYISILSYDLTTNSYITTEILNTDSNGAAIGYVVHNTQWYRFILTYDNEIVLETSPMKITGSPVNFQVTLGTDYFATYDIVQGVACSVRFNNNTNTFRYTFSDPSGNVAQGCLKLVRRLVVSDETVNESCISSSSSTILIVPSNITNNTYIGYGSIYVDGLEFGCGVESVSFDEGYQTYGTTGLFVSFLIILTLAMVGVWHPVVGVVLMLVGIIVVNIIGFFHLNWEWLIGLILIGGIAIYRLRK